MTDSTPTSQVPPGIEKILRRFAGLSPDLTRQALVQYSNKLPPLPERFRALDTSQYRVHECQTPVAIFPEVVMRSAPRCAHTTRATPPRRLRITVSSPSGRLAMSTP